MLKYFLIGFRNVFLFFKRGLRVWLNKWTRESVCDSENQRGVKESRHVSLCFHLPSSAHVLHLCWLSFHINMLFLSWNSKVKHCFISVLSSFRHLFSAAGEYLEQASRLPREPELLSPVGCAAWCQTEACQNRKHSALQWPKRKRRQFSRLSRSNPESRCGGCSRRAPPATETQKGRIQDVLHLYSRQIERILFYFIHRGVACLCRATNSAYSWHAMKHLFWVSVFYLWL